MICLLSDKYVSVKLVLTIFTKIYAQNALSLVLRIHFEGYSEILQDVRGPKKNNNALILRKRS